jgi:ABC-type Fe3+-hydroxamate transport system substrate-binding protein
MKRIRMSILFVAAIVLLSACSGSSFNEASKQAGEAVKTALKEKAKKPNEKVESIAFYMPFGYEIKKKSPNNIILKNGSKTYILFYNQQEDTSSKVVYKATVAQHKKLDTDEKYSKDGKLGYLLIEKLNKDNNELTVGIGGTKITTETKTASMKSEAQTMMEIVNSVKVKK